MTIHILTYATDAKKLEPLLASAKLHDISVQNLCTTTNWNGLQDKLVAMRTFVETCKDTDILCFVDAYDVIINESVKTIEKVFLESNAAILFGAEKQLDPPCISVHEYPIVTTSEYRFLNSGVYIGYASSIRKMLSSELYIGKNDQEFCNLYFIQNYKSGHLKLDAQTSFVLNMFKVSRQKLTIENGQITYNDTTPCFIHFNGMSFLDFETDFIQNSKGQMEWNGIDVSVERLQKYVDAKSLTQSGRFLCYCTTQGHSSLV